MNYDELNTAVNTLLRSLPEHKCSLSIEHNRHKDYYETVEEYLNSIEDFYDLFSSEDALAKCIDTNEIWELQWYSNTLIGFNAIAAPTLLDLLLLASSSCGHIHKRILRLLRRRVSLI